MTCVLCKWDEAYEPSLLEGHLTGCEAYAHTTRLEQKRRAKLFSLLSAPVPDDFSPEGLMYEALGIFDDIRVERLDKVKPFSEQLENDAAHSWHQYLEWREVMEKIIANVREKGHAKAAQELARHLLANASFDYRDFEVSFRVPGGQESLQITGVDPLKMGKRARELFGDPSQHMDSSLLSPAGDSQSDLEIQELRHQNELRDLQLQHVAALEVQREEAQDESRLEREQSRRAISELQERLATTLEASLAQLVTEIKGQQQQRRSIPEVILTDTELLRGQLAQLSRDLKAEQELRAKAVSEILSRDNSIQFYRSELSKYRELHSQVALRRNNNIHAGLQCRDLLIDLLRQRPYGSDQVYQIESALEKRLVQYQTGVLDGGPGQIFMLLDEEKQSLLEDLERAKSRLQKAATRVARTEEERGTMHKQLTHSRKELEAAAARVATADENTGTLRGQLEQCRRELEIITACMAKAEEEEGSLRKQLELFQKELETTTANLAQAAGERESLRERFKQSQKELEITAANLTLAEEEKGSLRCQLEAWRELGLAAHRVAMPETEGGIPRQQPAQLQQEVQTGRPDAYRCHLCTDYHAFRTEESLANHNSEKHPDVHGPKISFEARPGVPKAYWCDLCPHKQGYATRANLTRHKRLKHSDVYGRAHRAVPKTYWCDLCPHQQGYVTRDNLARHKRSKHSDIYS